MLPPDLKLKAERAARTQEVSLGEFIRRAVAVALNGAEDSGRTQDPLFSLPVWDGPPTPMDLAENHDYYLYDVDDKTR